MFGQYSPEFKGQRTIADLKESAQRAHYLSVLGNFRRIANNTVAYTLTPGREIIRHQDTDIIERDAKGVTFNSGGYQTLTTKDRMNRFGPHGFNIHSARGWIITTPAGQFPFVDGARFDLAGKPDATTRRLMERTAKRREADKKLITKSLKAFARDGIKHDPAGDPWVVPDKRGLLDGDMVRDWLRTGYITSRLFALALLKAGCGPMWVAQAQRNALDRKPVPSHEVSKLRRYLKLCLDVGA